MASKKFIVMIHIFLQLKLVTVNGHSIFECKTSIKSLLPNPVENKGHGIVSIFSDVSEDLSAQFNLSENLKEGQFSLTIQNLTFENFQTHLDSIVKDNLEGNFVILIPSTQEDALRVLDDIGFVELKNFQKSKTTYIIIWPIICPEGNCLQSKIFNHTFSSLPPTSSDTYILSCGNGNARTNSNLNLSSDPLQDMNSWELFNIFAVGRENSIRLDSVPLDNFHSAYFNKADFKGKTIKAAVPLPGSLHKEELAYNIKNDDNSTVEIAGGLSADVVLYLRDSLRFKLELEIKKGNFARRPNEPWSEMAHQLLDDHADISLVKETITPLRQESFNFLIPHFVEGVQAYFQQPPASSIRNIFLQPFTKGVWSTLIAVWVLVGLSTIIAANIKASHEQLLEQDKEISKDSILWAIALTCQQGWHLDPQSISIKVIFFCGSLMGLIVYVAYSAALVSTLSTTVIPIKSFGELLQSDFSITFQPNSQTMDLILPSDAVGDAEYGVEQAKILRSKKKNVTNKIQAVEYVLNSRTAYLSFPDNFYTTAKGELGTSDRYLCEHMTSLKFSKVPFRSGMLVGKHSRYKEFFNHRLICLYENGLMRRFQKNYILSFRGECDKQRRKKGQDLGLKDLFTAYVVILSGYALSITIFLMELLYARKFKKDVVAMTRPTTDSVD